MASRQRRRLRKLLGVHGLEARLVCLQSTACERVGREHLLGLVRLLGRGHRHLAALALTKRLGPVAGLGLLPLPRALCRLLVEAVPLRIQVGGRSARSRGDGANGVLYINRSRSRESLGKVREVERVRNRINLRAGGGPGRLGKWAERGL